MNTSMRGVEHVRRRDVDLEKVWDVESATGNGVLYVTKGKNETSKRPIRQGDSKPRVRCSRGWKNGEEGGRVVDAGPGLSP